MHFRKSKNLNNSLNNIFILMDIISQDEIIYIKNSNKVVPMINKKISFLFRLIGNISIIFFLLIILIKIRILQELLDEIKKEKNFEDINNISEKKNHKQVKTKFGHKLKNISKSEINFYHQLLLFESNISYLNEINKKRIFEKRYPLPKEINCYEHMREFSLMDLIAFTSFLTKDTIFFEFGSGCTSVMAKYFTNKSFAVEGNKIWYEIGLKNNLKDNILFKDIKPINKDGLWSTPGKESNLEDWKNYFMAYKAEYNANVIFIDGRFRVACAFDIFNKIKNDTIILIHEYYRPQYLIIEKYYDYIYHWGTLYLFKKKANINLFLLILK